MGIAHRDAMGQCFKLEGEVEARNVQVRLGMTAEQRAATPPWETEDMPENQQIARFAVAVEALTAGKKNGRLSDVDQKRLTAVIRGLGTGELKHPRFTKDNSGTTSYRWNPPTFTAEELKRSEKANADRIRRAAAGWDASGEWQRAMGVTPRK